MYQTDQKKRSTATVGHAYIFTPIYNIYLYTVRVNAARTWAIPDIARKNREKKMSCKSKPRTVNERDRRRPVEDGSRGGRVGENGVIRSFSVLQENLKGGEND